MPSIHHPYTSCSHVLSGMCAACAESVLDERDRYKKSLETIRKNAGAHLTAMAKTDLPSDAPERINAGWYYTEATSALFTGNN